MTTDEPDKASVVVGVDVVVVVGENKNHNQNEEASNGKENQNHSVEIHVNSEQEEDEGAPIKVIGDCESRLGVNKAEVGQEIVAAAQNGISKVGGEITSLDSAKKANGLVAKNEIQSSDWKAREVKSSRRRSSEQHGQMRHMIALLALSAIVLANMNRQAYNQALVRMVKRVSHSATTPPTISTVTTNSSMNPDETATLSTEAALSIVPTLAPTTLSSPQESAGTETVDVKGNPTLASAETTDDTQTVPNDQQHHSSEQQVNEDDEDRYDWTGSQISVLQAAFSYGYMPFMIPGGRMSELYGAKWVIFLSSFGSAVCCVLTPFLADTNFVLLVACRALMGKLSIEIQRPLSTPHSY